MSTITFEKFDIGLDRRRGRAVADANRLWECRNASITNGKVIRKKPGITLIQTLLNDNSGNPTYGLVAGFGKLNVFSEDYITTPDHGNSLFDTIRVAHPTVPGQTIDKIHHGETFQGFMYVSVEYDNGDIYHQYSDFTQGNAGAGPIWQATTAYSLNEYIAPTTAVLGAANPGLRYKCTTAGTSGGAEPTWPTTVGATVPDGTCVWTAESTWVQDTSCPHHPSFTKQSEKIFSPDGDVTRFCASAVGTPPAPNARDWTTSNDAGFINHGSESKGALDGTAVGQYQERLVIFMADGAQVWDTDPDPANIVIYKALEGIGSQWPESLVNFQGDLVFAATPGFRSIQLATVNESLEENDIGTPIDDLVGPLQTNQNVRSVYLPATGQYWAFISNGTNTTAWVFTFSRTNKIKAWAQIDYTGYNIQDVAVLNGKIYFRDANNVFEIDDTGTIFTDNGMTYEMNIEMPYMTFKKPGSTKYIAMMDLVLTGDPGGELTVQFRWDPNDETLITNPITLTIPSSGVLDTRVQQQIPVELTSAAVAPVFKSVDNKKVQIDMFQFHYEELGVI